MKPMVWLVSVLSAILLTTDTYAQNGPNPFVGHHLYRSYCLVCHGADGKGAGPVAEKMNLKPSDLSSEQYQKSGLDDLAAVIGGYRAAEESDMPNWSMVLSRKDLLDISAYISKITQKGVRFRGNTHRGRAIFKSACMACHGKTGTGRGLLAHLIHISMMDFTESEDMKKLSDEDLMNIIRDGSGDYMPSWKGILSESEIVDVASYVRLLEK